MPQPRKFARAIQWRKSKKEPLQWWLFYRDASSGKQRRILCEAHGAKNAAQRRELERKYRSTELQDEAEAMRRGGRLAYDTLLISALKEFETRTKERREARDKNPDARQGISAETEKALLDAVKRLREWLKSKGLKEIKTGTLGAGTLERFFEFLATEETRHGNKKIRRSAVTINKYRRHLRACFGYLDSQRPPLFPDFKSLQSAFKATRANPKRPTAFTPNELHAFVKKALERESPRLESVTRRVRGTRKNATHLQTVTSNADTPVSRLVLLLALTGCRLSEALALKWADVDLPKGQIRIHSTKTNWDRTFPLTRALESAVDVAPNFLELLQHWKQEAGKAVHVLPHGKRESPAFSKGAWQGANEAAKVRRIGPQMLRQNFTSYAAALGIPPAVCALWQGHGANVAERHYRAQVLERQAGKTFEDAMGLTWLIRSLTPDTPEFMLRTSGAR